jgi:hypothetical protein
MPLPNELALAGKFITEALAKYDRQVDDPVYPEYWAYEGQYHQAIADLNFGTQDLKKTRTDYTGRAVNYGGKATSIPLANFGISQDNYKTSVGVLAAEWTWQELRAEEQAQNNEYMTNVDVVSTYRMALEKGLREWMHYKSVFGEVTSAGNFAGLLTSPWLEVISVAAGANGITGTGATAQTAYDWVRQEQISFAKDTKLTGMGTAVLTSIEARGALLRRFTDGSNAGTAMDLLVGQNGLLRSVNALNEFSGDQVRDAELGNRTTINSVAIPETADLLLMMDADVQNNVKRHFADIDYLDVYTPDGGMTYRQVGMCATSEVIISKPFACRLYVLNRS